jgi:hypothetical protein
MVQYYRDLWARRSDMLAPLTALVGECGQTKITKAKGTKKLPWHWDEVHQRAFDYVKATIARDVVLAYPDYSEVFEIYTNASSKQIEKAYCILQLETLHSATQVHCHQI